MNLFQNPFFIIGVSTRDSKQAVVDACDQKSLTVDVNLCLKARTILTQPRNRLAAELAWLPGLSPTSAIALIKKIQNEPTTFLSDLHSIAPLPRCNALVAFLEQHKPNVESQIINILINIAQSFEKIDYSNVMSEINEDRQIAKIPAVQDVESIKQEMQTRQEYIIDIMKSCLNNTNAPDQVLTGIVEKTTSAGKQHPPVLIEKLTNKYQIEVQKYLDQLVDKIKSIIKHMRENHCQSFENQMTLLYKYLKTWDQIAQPIQLIHNSKGLDDPHSKNLARDLRNLAVDIANKYDMLLEAKQITKITAEIFKELPQFSDIFSEDLSTLDEIINRKAESVKEERQWREERTLNIEYGLIFRKKLIITPEVITFNNNQIPTDEVSRVRWGIMATKQSVNFVPVGTTYNYSIWIGNDNNIFHVEPPERNIYDTIINKLWNAVCERLVFETLRKLSEGEYISYGRGDAIVNKDGIMLKKHKLIGHDPYYARWEDLRISNGNGTFIISSDSEKKASAELSYRETDNVQILETIMRFLWKDGNYLKLRRGDFLK